MQPHGLHADRALSFSTCSLGVVEVEAAAEVEVLPQLDELRVFLLQLVGELVNLSFHFFLLAFKGLDLLLKVVDLGVLQFFLLVLLDQLALQEANLLIHDFLLGFQLLAEDSMLVELQLV